MIEQSAPAGPGRRNRLAVVLAGVSLALSLLACGVAGVVALRGDVGLLPVQDEPRAASAGETEAVAHVTLPPGTVFLSAVYSNGLETRLSAKFRIPRDQLDAFVAAGAFTAAMTPGLRAVTAADGLGGGTTWDPQRPASVSGIDEQQPGPDHTHREVLFDLDAQATITVYLSAVRG